MRAFLDLIAFLVIAIPVATFAWAVWQLAYSGLIVAALLAMSVWALHRLGVLP